MVKLNLKFVTAALTFNMESAESFLNAAVEEAKRVDCDTKKAIDDIFNAHDFIHSFIHLAGLLHKLHGIQQPEDVMLKAGVLHNIIVEQQLLIQTMHGAQVRGEKIKAQMDCAQMN